MLAQRQRGSRSKQRAATHAAPTWHSSAARGGSPGPGHTADAAALLLAPAPTPWPLRPPAPGEEGDWEAAEACPRGSAVSKG